MRQIKELLNLGLSPFIAANVILITAVVLIEIFLLIAFGQDGKMYIPHFFAE